MNPGSRQIFSPSLIICLEEPVWKNFMALASSRPDCLVSSSGADYKAWSGADQNCNVFVRSAASQRLVSHKAAASQPLIGGQLIKFWLKKHFN